LTGCEELMSRDSFSAIVDVWVEKSAEDLEAEEFIGYFEGVASTPAFDLEGDRFSEDVLRRNAERLSDKPILLIHGRDPSLGPVAVGRILEARYVNGKLRIKAGIYKSFEEVWRKVKEGLLKALSIGGLVKVFRRLPGGGREITDAEITEVSLTPRGLNPEAKIIYAFGKSYKIQDGLLAESSEALSSSERGLLEAVSRLGAELAELKTVLGPLLAAKSADLGRGAASQPERRPKALASRFEVRGGSAEWGLFTPVFDDVWRRISARRASQSYKGSGG